MACIILYKGEEIPYAEWVDRLEKGLLDKLINDGTIDIAQFKGEFTPIEKKEEVKKEEVETPKVSKQPTSQAEVKNKLIELGISEEEAEVSSRIYDAYVRNKAAKTGRTIEDVYGDIEFEREIEEEGLMQMPNGEIVKTKVINADVVNGFYSPIEKNLMEYGKDKIKAKDWLNVVGKGDEAVFTGVRAFIESKDPNSMLSKQEILSYMKENRIVVKEVVKEETPSVKDSDLRVRFDGDGFTIDVNKKGISGVYIGLDELDVDYNGENYEEVEAAAIQEGLSQIRGGKQGDETKFSQYQLEGEKENYKEVLVTLPRMPISIQEQKEFNDLRQIPTVNLSKEQRERKEELVNKIKGESKFKSTHFEEPNILVHLRMNTRTDADGNKVLFLEEIQSDWGQKGKKEGFEIKEEDRWNFEPIKRNNEIVAWKIELKSDKNIGGIGNTKEDAIKDANKRYGVEINALEKQAKGVPTAPFVMDTNAWTKLGLKVALKEAVAQGVDKIAWTTGTQQFDRWGTEKIDWVKTNKGWTINIQEQFSGTAFEGMNIDEKALSEKGTTITSKEDLRAAIDRTLSREKNEAERQKLTDRIWDRMQKEDSGTSLPRKEGMESFYGTEGTKGIVGGVAEKLFGQKVGTVEIQSENFDTKKIQYLADKYDVPTFMISKAVREGDLEGQAEIGLTKDEVKVVEMFLRGSTTQPSIDITPKLKAEVEQGQSLFQKEKSTPKGRITFTDLKSIMAIGKKGDASTFIHELSHHDLQGYIDAAKNGDEKAINSLKAVIRSTYPKISETEVNKKLAEVLKIDRTQENVRGTEYEKIHEHYARGFEKWMKDGDKAGFSAEMVALFEKMKEFLTRIYEGLKLSPIDVQFSPEVEQMYRDMFGVEYKEITEQLKETKELIEEDTTNEILDRDNLDDLFGDLGGGLQQAQQRSYTPKELLLAKAEQLFRNYETDEFNVIEDLKTFVDGLSITDKSKELYKEEIDKNAKELESKIAYDKEVRMIAEKILSSKETSPEMKKAARKNATYNQMQLRGEADKADRKINEAEKTDEGLLNMAKALLSDIKDPKHQTTKSDIALAIQTLRRVSAKYQRAKIEKDTDTINKLQGVHDKLVEMVSVMGTDAGQSLNVFKLMKHLIPDMYATSLKNLRERGMTATERKEMEKKMQDLADKLAKFQESESWATEQLISAEEKIEKQKELLREIQKENEKLREAKKFIEKEEAKPSEKAESNTKTNEQFSTPKVRKFSGSQAVKERIEALRKRIEALRKRMQGGGLQQAMLSDEAEMYETMLDFVGSEIEEGRKVKISSFIKAFDGISDIETLIDAYVSTKNTLIGEVNIKNFSTDSEIETYRKNKLDSAKLAENEKKETQTQDQLEILEYEKILKRVNKLKQKIENNDLEMKITPKVNSERIFFLRKEEAKLKKELDDLRKEAKVANWSDEEVMRKRIEKDYDLAEKSEIKAIKDKQKEIDRINIKLANLEEKSEEKRILSEYKARVEEELSREKVSEAAQNVLADKQNVKIPKAPVVLYRPTQGNQITLAEVDKLNKEKGGNVDVDDLRREFRLGYIGAQELMNAYNKVLVERQNNKVRKFVDENYGREVTKKLDDGTIVKTREKFTDEEFEALIETPIANNRTIFDIIQIQMDRQATIKAFEKEQKRREALMKNAPKVVANRILSEAEDRKYLREPKKKDVLQKLKDILTKKAINTFATKPQALKNPNATIAEKLADYLDQELLQQGKDWDVEIRTELEKQIDNSKYSDLDKRQLKEFVNEFLNSRTETLLTNAVSDKIIKEILERGFPTKDGKVDWRDILKKNNNNYNEAKQFLKDELAFEIGSDKLANDVIDAIEKRFEKDSNDRKERFLAGEINKALGKEERSKTPRKMNTMLKKLIELSNIGGLNDDVFFKYFAKDFGFETFNQVEMDRITDYLNKIQALPEGEEKNRMIQELSAYVKIAESEGAFAWETFMAYMYKNMLGHIFTAAVNATSVPTVLAKAAIRSIWDANNWKIAKEAMFQKAALKTALQQGYKKGGMKFEESGTDKTLPQFDAVEQAFKLADEIESKIQRGLAKVFANATKYSGLLYLNRFLEGTDSMTRNSAEEMRAYKALKAEIDAEYEARGENPSNNIKAIREEAMRRLYPITNSQALQLAFNEFVSVGVQPTPAQVQRRAFEMQQQMRSDDVRKLAEEEGLRETHRSKPVGYQLAHGSAFLIDAVRIGLEGLLNAWAVKSDSADRNVQLKMATSFIKATQMPFVGIIMNILEKGLELNPYYGGAKLAKNLAVLGFGEKARKIHPLLGGAIRGDRGVLTEKERKDQQLRDVTYNAARLATGLLLAYSFELLGAFDDDEDDWVEIYGNNPQGRANLRTGLTLPKNVVSIKNPFGKGRFNIPIGYFSVWSPELSIKAAEQDFRRQEKFKSANLYNELDELHEANKMAIRQYIETIVKGLPTAAPVHTYEMLEKTLDGDSNGAMMGTYLGNLVTTMALPDARMLKDIYAAIDPNTYEATTFKEGFMTSAGFMFNKFYDTRPMYDYRGRLIDIRDRRASSISGVIRSTTKNIDPIDKVLTENNVLIIPTNQNKETDKYQKVDKDGLLTPLTPEENYTNYLEINKKFDAMLTDSTLVKGKPKLGSILDFQELKEKDIKKFMKDGLPKEVAEKKATIEFKKNVQQEYKDLEEKMLLEKGIKKVDTKMKEKDLIKRLKLNDM